MKPIDMAIALFLVAFAMLIASFARGATFEDLWLTRIKPPPYGGVATEFDDRRGAWGNRINPKKDMVCAHMLEARGQHLLVTNVENGKSVVCSVRDRGPNRKFWPRREVDLTPKVNKAIGCDGMCKVEIERVP